MEAGVTPVAGGIGDQTDWFLSAYRYLRSERQSNEEDAAEKTRQRK